MKSNSNISESLIRAARKLGEAASQLSFAAPVAYVYNPLAYAWAPHELYLKRFGCSSKRVIFLGMNPGPFGMTQTGVPFGEIAAVRDWLRIEAGIERPTIEHPRRPIQGFACGRSEVSGQRLWGLFAQRFGSADAFFEDHIVMNYCPLAFLEESGRNHTPDKLPAGEKEQLFAICDRHLRDIVAALEPEWLIGIGDFAARRAQAVFYKREVKIARILHPSPASPAANRDWNRAAATQLEQFGVWNGKGNLSG